MFDFELQMRFWRSATDAAFGWGQASMAAAQVWQNQALADAGHQPAAHAPRNMFNGLNGGIPQDPWNWALSLWQPLLQSGAAWPLQSASYSPAMSFWGAQSAAAPLPWAGLFEAFMTWPANPWALYQTPLTAMMMSAGMPYTVALPSARASTAAMDAADCARQQVMNVFSSGGGHGPVRSFWG